MSYIQDVYGRLPDEIMEKCIEGWEVDFDGERMFLEVCFDQLGYNRACWEVWLSGFSFYVTPICGDSAYLGYDLIAIGRLVDAMNTIANDDVMASLSEKH